VWLKVARGDQTDPTIREIAGEARVFIEIETLEGVT